MRRNSLLRRLESAVAVLSFAAAVVFAFVSLYLSVGADLSASQCGVIAMFLSLAAALFHIDLRFHK